LPTLRNILSASKLLLCFKKPRFGVLEVIDLVIDDKPLLLIAWKLEYGIGIKMEVFSKKYFRSCGTSVLGYRERTNTLEIKAFNLWRTTKVKVSIKHTTLDQKSAKTFTQQLQPLSTINLKSRTPGVRVPNTLTKLFPVNTHPLNIHVTKQLTLLSNRLKFK